MPLLGDIEGVVISVTGIGLSAIGKCIAAERAQDGSDAACVVAERS